MKILINGYTVTENIQLKRSYTRKDMSKLDNIIGHIKRNKKKYLMLVLAVAILIDLSGLTLVDATVAAMDIKGLEATISGKVGDIIGLLILLSRYACMGMGLKEMIICLLNGGNMKEASYAGIQYWVGYLFLQFYPQLF
ncbi:MAG: hypothetical protein ACRCXT_19720 [Paraclostridium sp.]